MVGNDSVSTCEKISRLRELTRCTTEYPDNLLRKERKIKIKETALASAATASRGVFYEWAPYIILAGTSARVSTFWGFSLACSYAYPFNRLRDFSVLALSVYETLPIGPPKVRGFSN